MFDLENYWKAESVDDAITKLKQNPEARLISGGTDVLIKLHGKQQGFSKLVDIHGLKELNFIKMDDDENIFIGSGMTFINIIESDIIKKHIPILKEAASTVGGPQIRNVATIGGNICNGVTSADSATSLFAMNAVLVIKVAEGEQEIPIEEFYLGPGKVALKQSDILIGFKIKKQDYKGYYGHYYKYAMRNAMDIATIGCAGILKIKDGILEDLRIAYGVAGPVPMRCKSAESKAVGKKLTDTLLQEIAGNIEKEVNPRTSWRASKDFRINIIKELSKRVIQEATAKAGEKIL